jgi:hypothetical protein
MVQWKWMKRTKSFLVIFHFVDDFSEPNLRMSREYANLMTWAPSHVELGLLGEILRYANIIDGLSATEKLALRYKLQGVKKFGGGGVARYVVVPDLKGSKEVVFEGKGKEPYFCPLLCPEYIDYLKEVLKPYISC